MRSTEDGAQLDYTALNYQVFVVVTEYRIKQVKMVSGAEPHVYLMWPLVALSAHDIGILHGGKYFSACTDELHD